MHASPVLNRGCISRFLRKLRENFWACLICSWASCRSIVLAEFLTKLYEANISLKASMQDFLQTPRCEQTAWSFSVFDHILLSCRQLYLAQKLSEPYQDLYRNSQRNLNRETVRADARKTPVWPTKSCYYSGLCSWNVCMCMYIYIYMYMYMQREKERERERKIRIEQHVDVHCLNGSVHMISIYTIILISLNVYVHMCICTYTYTYIYIYIYAHVLMCIQIYTYKDIYTYTCIYIYTYICIHTSIACAHTYIYIYRYA